MVFSAKKSLLDALDPSKVVLNSQRTIKLATKALKESVSLKKTKFEDLINSNSF